MRKEKKHRKIFILLLCIILAVFLTGYTVVAGVRVILDQRLKSGGDVFFSEGVEDFDIFEDLRPPFGGEAVIKPGSEGTYSFAVENRGDAPMDVYFRLFDENAYGIPMEYRLKTGSQYLFGSETNWEDGGNLDRYEMKDTLQENARREYKLDWCWADGRGADGDAKDTWIGNQAAAGNDVTYTLSISLRAETDLPEPTVPEETTEPESPTDSEETESPGGSTEQEETTMPHGSIDPEEETIQEGSQEETQQVVVDDPNTGDGAKPWIYAGAAVAAVAVFLLVPPGQKKREEEDEAR